MFRSTLLVALFAFSATAAADDFRYSSVTASYGIIEADGSSVDADTMGLGLSFAVSEDFFLTAGFSTAESDLDREIDTLAAGFGYHHSISDRLDLVGQLSYQRMEFSGAGLVSQDDDGFGLGVGLRFAATELVELNASIDYVDLDLLGDDTAFGAGVLFNVTDSFTLGLNGTWDDNISVYSAGARFYFGE
jgi:opacity protein-like surface antigen